MCKKSHQHSGERLTEAIYTEASAKVEASKVTGHRVSTSGMLKFLGVSRSGYRSFLNRTVSATKQRKEAMKKKIQTIYNDSKQNYGPLKQPGNFVNPAKPLLNALLVNTCVK